MTFERKYSEEYSPKARRDRFQVEFNEEERKFLLEAQEYLQQHKDATALKQLAYIGWLAISNQAEQMRFIRHTLFKNDRNNKRLGVSIENELNDKIQRIRQETGWKL